MIDKNLTSYFSPPQTEGSFFISFEGIEGSGKSTQIQFLKEKLEARGYKVLLLREPGGTPFGENLRQAILNSRESVSPLAEAMLFASSRAQLLESKILPALSQKNTIVIVDRYIDSSLAYQGIARGLGAETVLKLHRFSPLNTLPHISFYLKIGLDVSFERQKQRGNGKDYFERESEEFYCKLIEGYDLSAKLFPQRIVAVNGEQDQSTVASAIEKHITELITKKDAPNG